MGGFLLTGFGLYPSTEVLSGRILFQPCTVGNLFSESCNHWSPLVTYRRGNDHPLRFITAQLPRLEVRNHDDLLSDQGFGFIVLGNACQHLARLWLANVDRQQEKFVGFRYSSSGQHLTNLHLNLREVANLDESRNTFGLADSVCLSGALHRRCRLCFSGGGAWDCVCLGSMCPRVFDFVHNLPFVDARKQWFH